MIHMIREDIREELRELEYNDSLLFDNPSFDDAIIGYTETGRVIYDYDLMVESLARESNIDTHEAADFISYNTIRALAYQPKENAPIILYRFECKEIDS